MGEPPGEKVLNLYCGYILLCLYIYISSYKAVKNTGQTDHCIRTLMYIYIYFCMYMQGTNGVIFLLRGVLMDPTPLHVWWWQKNVGCAILVVWV